ncbi:DegV family protein [Virgibacillus soli]|uniref:DegV family protein n=1 Tax=Paracerasibacillus soli TaxID=480284 RepID=UPI0035EABF76
MNVQLMTDGGADIPQKLMNTLDIKIVPLYLHFKDGQYKTGELDMTSFFNKIKETNELPRSAAPSPHDFYEAYKSVDPERPILMLSLTKGLSSTYENAVTAKNMLLEDEPNRKIEVINTKTASCGIALLMYESSKKLAENYTFEQLVEHLKERVEQTTTLFVLKTLENLILGGRLDKVRGAIAKTLNVKLIMKASEDKGDIEVIEKVRGDKKAVRRFIELIGEHTKNAEGKVIAMTHCVDEKRAQTVLDEINQTYPFADSLLSETGPLISTYGGEGALVISFFNN